MLKTDSIARNVKQSSVEYAKRNRTTKVLIAKDIRNNNLL
jgi:hypothetical protein